MGEFKDAQIEALRNELAKTKNELQQAKILLHEVYEEIKKLNN